MKTTYQMDIHAPIEKVFECIDNEEKMKQWMDGLVGSEYISKPTGDNPVGTIFKQKIKEGGRIQEYDGEVIAFEQPSLLGVRISNKMFAVDVYYRLEQLEKDKGTRLNYECQMQFFNRFAAFMGKVFSGFSRKILDKQMKKLKVVAEQ